MNFKNNVDKRIKLRKEHSREDRKQAQIREQIQILEDELEESIRVQWKIEAEYDKLNRDYLSELYDPIPVIKCLTPEKDPRSIMKNEKFIKDFYNTEVQFI